ncbi:MAG: NYN domain-containing protein [Halobacteriales archaeon]
MRSIRREPEGRVGLFVDGPNVFRSEFHADLDDLREAAASFGRLGVARVYLDADAPADLLRAVEAHGFEAVVTSGDVDVRLAVDATEAVAGRGVETIAIASRDLDFKPVLETAKRRGVRTVAIAPGEHGRSEGLTAAAGEAVLLEEG